MHDIVGGLPLPLNFTTLGYCPPPEINSFHIKYDIYGTHIYSYMIVYISQNIQHGSTANTPMAPQSTSTVMSYGIKEN